MTYKTEFPDYKSAIPAVFLSAPWQDESYRNDTCPSFCRPLNSTEEDRGKEIHVYVDEEQPELREIWTGRDGEQQPCPRYTVRFTDEDGCFLNDEEAVLDFSTNSLVEVLGNIRHLTGEVV
jgi:hypothetical protein